MVTRRGSYGKGKKGRVLIKVLALCRRFVCAGMPFWDFVLISTAQARAELASKKSQFLRRRFTGCSCSFSAMNFIWYGRCKEAVTCGGLKREFTWQVRGIGHVVKFVAGAEFCGRC